MGLQLVEITFWKGEAVSQACRACGLVGVIDHRQHQQLPSVKASFLLTFFLLPFPLPFLQDPSFCLSQQIFLSEDGKPIQTDLLNISWPAICQPKLQNSGYYC